MSDAVAWDPPPPPLAWLFPELLDLVAQPPTESLDALMARGVTTIALPRSPLGRSLLPTLRPRLRARGVRVALTDDATPDWTDRLAAHATHETGAVTLRPLTTLASVRTAADDADRARLTIPYFATWPSPDADATSRVAPSWWGLVHGDAHDAAFRTATRALIARLHPDRYWHYVALENAALAGFDDYAEAVAGRPPIASRAVRPLVIGVEGIDGAGKSTHVAAIRRWLDARGLRTAVHKIYRHGVFHDTVTDLTRRCAGERNLHLWRTQRLVKAFDSVKYFAAHVEPDFATHDVILFDRYVDTHFAAAHGRYHRDPWLRELLAVYPPADRVYWLDASIDDALAAIADRPARTVDENAYMLGRYHHALADRARARHVMRIDARAPFDANHGAIVDDLDTLLAERRAR